MKFRQTIPLIALATAVILSGCYPDESVEEPGLTGLRLPLHELGIHVTEDALTNWLGWLGDDDLTAPFDMGQPGNDFALGLRLYSFYLDGEIGFQGKTVTLFQDSEELWVDMLISDCQECWFEVVIFWRDYNGGSPVIRTFTGDNGVTRFNVPPDVDTTLDVWLEQVGEVHCNAGARATPAGSRVAARDVREHIRLPAVEVQPDASPVAVLPDLPFGRLLAIELDPIGDGRFYSTLDEITLPTEAGGSVVSVDLP